MKIKGQSPLKLIRRHCLECAGGSSDEVRFCSGVSCQLWYLRFGARPKTLLKKDRHLYEELFEKANFETGGKFDPDHLAGRCRSRVAQELPETPAAEASERVGRAISSGCASNDVGRPKGVILMKKRGFEQGAIR